MSLTDLLSVRTLLKQWSYNRVTFATHLNFGKTMNKAALTGKRKILLQLLSHMFSDSGTSLNCWTLICVSVKWWVKMARASGDFFNGSEKYFSIFKNIVFIYFNFVSRGSLKYKIRTCQDLSHQELFQFLLKSRQGWFTLLMLLSQPTQITELQ